MSLAQRSLQVVALVCTFIVGAASMAVIVTQTTWFREWLRGVIVRQAEGHLNGQLSIGRLDGNLFFGVELEDVGVTMNGETLVAVKDIRIDYNAFRPFDRRLVLDDIRLTEPVFRLEKDQQGWNILRLVKARTSDRDRPTSRPAIEIGEIDVTNGTVHVSDSTGGTSGVVLPSRVEQLDASFSVASDEQELTVAISRASFRSAAPLDVKALSGVIRRRAQTLVLENVALFSEGTSLRIDGTIGDSRHGSRTIDLEASSDRFDVEEIGRIVPVLRGYDLRPQFDLVASGRLDRLAVDVNLSEPKIGDVRAELTVDAAGPERQVAGTVAMTHLNVDPLVHRDVPSDITGDALIDLAMPAHEVPLRGTYSVNVERVQIVGYDASNVRAWGRIDGRVIQVNGAADGYGGRASAEGIITVGRPFTLNLTGQAAGVDLRNLPQMLHWPEAPSNLQFDYTLTGRSGIYSGSVRMDASTLAGASIAPGTTG
jgi:hypothetical protein